MRARPRPHDRTMPATSETPVLIVGAGPAGLAAAVELARHDVPALLVERRSDAVLAPARHRAQPPLDGADARPGASRTPCARAAPTSTARMLDVETLADAAEGDALEVGYPSRAQSRVLSPVEPACVAAGRRRAAAAAQRLARTACLLGTEVTGARAATATRATLRDVRTGSGAHVEARYVVAADGARSAVRRAARHRDARRRRRARRASRR